MPSSMTMVDNGASGTSVIATDRPGLYNTHNKQTQHTMSDTTYNGWANYETWNASLWIGNDEFLYNTAKACVTYREGLETPWDKFVRCMCEGQIGRMLCKTGDGVAWDDPAIDADEMNEMLWEL
jgi:hypothetical protein